MSRPVYLITGPAGSGKTTMADYLAARGYQCMEADSTPGLCYYVNKAGKPVPYPQGADSAWWSKHNYIWELDRLKKMLLNLPPGDGPVFLCGNAGNIGKAWDMFAAVFYLDLPTELILRRIKHGHQDHAFGQTPEEREVILAWAGPFKEEMLGLGAVTIDATKPVPDVAKAILSHVDAT